MLREIHLNKPKRFSLCVLTTRVLDYVLTHSAMSECVQIQVVPVWPCIHVLAGAAPCTGYTFEYASYQIAWYKQHHIWILNYEI